LNQLAITVIQELFWGCWL